MSVAGTMRIATQAVNLAQVIAAAVETVRPAAQARQIVLTEDVRAETVTVVGDAARLQQVVWNLLSNAVKFTPEHGRVSVRLAAGRSHAEIAVEDNGSGIEPEFISHLFDRFRQADTGSTRRHGGLGLGLAIVRHLVEAHGGTVSAASGGAGQGATFTVRLPLEEAPREKEQI